MQQLFRSLGLPMSDNITLALFEKCKSSTENEHVKWEMLYKEIQYSFVEQQPSSNNSSSNSLEDPGTERVSNNDNKVLKKFFASFQKEKVKSTVVESASLFSSLVRVDSLDICLGDDAAKSIDIANPLEARVAFSLTLKERKNDPLVIICERPEYRDAWVESFIPVVIPLLRKSTSPDVVEMRKKQGWEYLVVRSSFITHIIANEVELLECSLHELSAKDRKATMNSLDDYNGYSPLHYATTLCHTECMYILLENGADVTLKDVNGKSAMYHALRTRNDQVANVLEKFGADRNDDLKQVIDDEMAEQENEASTATTAKDEGVDTSNSDRSRESVTEALLMDAACKFG